MINTDFKKDVGNFSPACRSFLEDEHFNDEIDFTVSYLENNSNYFDQDNVHDILSICNKIRISPLTSVNAGQIVNLAEQKFPSTDVVNKERLSSLKKREFLEDIETPNSKKVKLENFQKLSDSEKRLLESVIQTPTKNESLKELFEVFRQDLSNQNSKWRESRNSIGKTILHYLSYFHILHVEQILALAKDVNIQEPKNKRSPLHYAYRHPKIVQLLLGCGVNVGLQDIQGYSAFYYAFMKEKYETVELLIEYDPQLIKNDNFKKKSAILRAVLMENEQLLELTLKMGADYQKANYHYHLIYEAASAENEKILQLLVNYGISIDFIPEGSATALYLACQFNNLAIVKKLIKAGADVNKDYEGVTPLIMAIIEGYEEIALYLVDHKADIHFTNRQGNTILHLAILHGRIALVHKLVNLGVNLNFIHSDLSSQIFILEVLENAKLSFSKIEELKIFLRDKGLNEKIEDQVISRKLLGHVWGFNKTFFIDNQEYAYEGLCCTSTTRKLKETFLEYLPSLKIEFPDYFTSNIESSLSLCLEKACVYHNQQSIKPAQIIEDSQKFPVILMTGWKGHATAVVIYKNFLAKCNRGECAEDHAIRIYHMYNPLKPNIIEHIRNEGKKFFLNIMDEKLALQQQEYICMKDQKVGNCSWASLKAAVFASLWLLSQKHSNEEIACRPFQVTKEIYKSYTSHVRTNELKAYLQKVEKGLEQLDLNLIRKIKKKLVSKSRNKNLTSIQKENLLKAWKQVIPYLNHLKQQ